jgi:hypothetical protein
VAVSEELRLGAETYSEMDPSNGSISVDWIGAGPDLAWTHGRFWLAGSVLVGLKGIDAAPRLNFAVAF